MTLLTLAPKPIWPQVLAILRPLSCDLVGTMNAAQRLALSP